VESSNLKFPHDQHLKAGVKSPKGRVTLECGSCHVPDSSERSFAPIEMKRHCVECHTLEFEPAVTSRQVPHGSVEEALLTMQEFYANISLSNVAVDTVDTGEIDRGLPRPSAAIVTDEQRKRALAFARFKAERVGTDLFEKRVCISCHDVRRKGSEPQGGAGAVSWTVAPVHIAATWMPKARFDRAAASATPWPAPGAAGTAMTAIGRRRHCCGCSRWRLAAKWGWQRCSVGRGALQRC
jgi:hypothetical protein